MAAKDPHEASLNASIARNTALSRQSPEQRRAQLAPAWAGTLRKLEDEVDPERVLTEADRAGRVTALRRVKMAELSKLAAMARKERTGRVAVS